MIKVTVYWEEGKEEYLFENQKDAQMFCADALPKCGQVTFKCEETVTVNDTEKYHNQK